MSPAEHATIWRATVLGAYAILWWLSFFVLLPIGMHNEDDPPGQFTLGEAPKPPSGKHKPRLLLKAGGATVIAAVLWCVLYALVLTGVIQL